MLGLDMLPAVGVHAYVSGGVHAMHTVFSNIIPCVKKESNRQAFLPVGCSCGVGPL